jgi:hypothetical protein
MEGFAMQDYCIELPEFTAERLEQQFAALSADPAGISKVAIERSLGFRPVLRQQYAAAFRSPEFLQGVRQA